MKQDKSQERVITIRQQMFSLLSKDEMSSRELSQAIGIREREVYDHLSHVSKSAAAQRKKLIMQPSRCLSCGYIFEDRTRLTRPGRCPRCKKSHLQEPTYRVSHE